MKLNFSTKPFKIQQVFPWSGYAQNADEEDNCYTVLDYNSEQVNAWIKYVDGYFNDVIQDTFGPFTSLTQPLIR